MKTKEQKEFLNIINNTIIPSTLSSQEMMLLLNPLITFVSSHLPERLYKYRSCNERNFDSLLRDVFWFSSPKTMNDSFDSRCFFDRKEVQQRIKANLPADFDTFYKHVFESGEGFANIFDGYPEIQAEYERIKKLPREAIEEKAQYLLPMIEKRNSEIISSVFPAMQQALRICSFSELNYSPAMWGLYADNETGFCLGFKFDSPFFVSSTEDKTVNLMLLPVIYNKTRYRVTTDYIYYMVIYQQLYNALQSNGYLYTFPDKAKTMLNHMICPDTFIPTKIVINKSLEWIQEVEWRMIYSTTDRSELLEDHIPVKLIPDEIYLGRRISCVNERILIDFAKDQNLTVYKMDLDDDNPTYKLISRKIM